MPLSRSRHIPPFRLGKLSATLLFAAGVGLIAAPAATAAAAQWDGNRGGGGPNLPCPDGTDLVAKFEVGGGDYAFEKGEEPEGTVSISGAGTTSGDWSSDVPISHVIVKGGPGAATVPYEPPASSGSFSNEELVNGGGRTPDISNVKFCAPPEVDPSPIPAETETPSPTPTDTGAASPSPSKTGTPSPTETGTPTPGGTGTPQPDTETAGDEGDDNDSAAGPLPTTGANVALWSALGLALLLSGVALVWAVRRRSHSLEGPA